MRVSPAAFEEMVVDEEEVELAERAEEVGVDAVVSYDTGNLPRPRLAARTAVIASCQHSASYSNISILTYASIKKFLI